MLTSANNISIQNLLFRMCFADASPASSAILYAMYALSSVHLSKHAQALEFESRCKSAIRASTALHPKGKDVLQRIVAVILLAMLETFENSRATQRWAESICYAKTAPINSYAHDESYFGDQALVLDWIFYYDVLSKFSLFHFDRKMESAVICARNKQVMCTEVNSPNKISILPTLGCSLEVLIAIYNIVDYVLNKRLGEEVPKEIFGKIERRLKYAQQIVSVESIDDYQLFNKVQHMRNTAELYRLAGMIYLHRAGLETDPQRPPVSGLIENAFKILQDMETCERTFPLFIVACEARTDERRATTLQVVNSTQAEFSPGNLIRLRCFKERFWAQEDLDVDQEIEYVEKVSAVLSTSDSLPAFV